MLVHHALAARRIVDFEDPHGRVVDQHFVVCRIRLHSILCSNGGRSDKDPDDEESRTFHEMPPGSWLA